MAATEWGKDGINVNVICPLAWTAQLEQFEKAYPDAFKANVHMPPMGHYGDVEKEIGRVCVQLASPDFKYLSGETLTLEGGMGLRPKLPVNFFSDNESDRGKNAFVLPPVLFSRKRNNLMQLINGMQNS